MTTTQTHARFHIGLDDRLVVDGLELRKFGQSGDTVYFKPADGMGMTHRYSLDYLARLAARGKVRHDVDYFLPADLRSVDPDLEAVSLSGLAPAAADRLAGRYALVRAYAALASERLLKKTDESIRANMMLIRERAEDYLAEEMPSPEYSQKLRRWKEEGGPKPRAMGTCRLPQRVSSRALRDWARRYEQGGKVALLDRVHRQGNRNSHHSLEERALMMRVVRETYLTVERRSIAQTFQAVKDAFDRENAMRAKNGLQLLRAPGREAVRLSINRLDRFEVLVKRHGEKEAMRRMKPVREGVMVSRPLERVEMDEVELDLILQLSQANLKEYFTEEELRELGFDNKKARWWVVMAIDCRTKCILGLTLTKNPKFSAAKDCLRMMVSDKGTFSNDLGATCPWSMFGLPEMLVVDNGSAFAAIPFTNACSELGIHKMQTIAGSPMARGTVERGFGTMETALLPWLSGRTFSNVVVKGDYDAEGCACLRAEDIATILVRWVVDAYHNTPHTGLGGRTPLEQWERDMAEGNYPLHAPPDERRKRLAFGLNLKRVVQKTGITVLGIRYTSEALASFFLQEGNVEVDVRWCDDDVGRIEARLGKKWYEINAVHDHYQGLSAQAWLMTHRALKARDPVRKAFDEQTVSRAITDIRAIVEERKAAFDIVDLSWTEGKLARIEQEAMRGFSTTDVSSSLPAAAEGFGHEIAPWEPEEREVASPERLAEARLKQAEAARRYDAMMAQRRARKAQANAPLPAPRLQDRTWTDDAADGGPAAGGNNFEVKE